VSLRWRLAPMESRCGNENLISGDEVPCKPLELNRDRRMENDVPDREILSYNYGCYRDSVWLRCYPKRASIRLFRNRVEPLSCVRGLPCTTLTQDTTLYHYSDISAIAIAKT
jgi:hypothetical protein